MKNMKKYTLILTAVLAISFAGFAQENIPREQLEWQIRQLQREGILTQIALQQPEFPGGQPALLQFLKENLRYPAEAIENGEQGRVVLRFAVERTGEIIDIEVVESVSPSLDAEAIRLVELMPNWNPGIQSDERVRMNATLPIIFRLQ